MDSRRCGRLKYISLGKIINGKGVTLGMKQEFWKSQYGFLMATIAGAVGIGNIWRFPYLLGAHGGGIFLLVYFLALFAVGIPMMILELSFGRKFKGNVIECFTQSRFKWLGYFIVLNLFLILSYYTVVVGWTLAYFFSFLISGAVPKFAVFIASGWPIWFTLLMITISGLVVYKGLRGVERSAKIMVPALVVLLVFLAWRALLLPNALEGLMFFLKPDLSKLSFKVVLAAFGQVFFSLGLSMGILITYGDFLRKRANIVKDSIITSFSDTGISILACLLTFPIVFSFAVNPAAGPGLAFVTLPLIFKQMAFGRIVGSIFFLALCIAGLSSVIAGMEVLYVSTKIHKKDIWLVCLILWLVSLPSATSSQFLDTMDYIAGTVLLSLIGLGTALVVGWKIGPKILRIESGLKTVWWDRIIKYLVPLVLLAVIFFGL